MTGPREQAREIVEAWWAANPTVDSRGSRDLVDRIAAALDEAQRGAPTGAESGEAQGRASSLREACACVIEAWAVAFNRAGGNAPAMDGAQRAAKMLRGEANWPWTVAEVAAAFGGARGVMPQIPPRIADIGLRPGDLSFACAVDDHEWCEGCAACDCHHKEGDP